MPFMLEYQSNRKGNNMIGGIIGDYVGSVYEAYQWQTKELPLLLNDNVENIQEIKPLFENTKWVRTDHRWTDDTLCTLALYKAYALKKDPVRTMVDICTKYENPSTGFGKAFAKWLGDPRPYGSYANGSIMRIGFLPLVVKDLATLLSLAVTYTEITHNHQDSIEAVVNYCLLMHNMLHYPVDERRNLLIAYINEHTQTKTLDEYHDRFSFELNAKETLNQAVCAVRHSNSFEDALKNCFYIGGDCDTLACVAGNIAALMYAVPGELEQKALESLKPEPELYNLAIHFKQCYKYTI